MIFNLKIQMNSAIILAGGLGKRMGESLPKQFIQVNNSMIIDYSIKAFQACQYIDLIIIVINVDWHEKLKKKYKNIKLVKGGKTRTESSFNGLISCSSKCKYVFIHDAARPLLRDDLIRELLDNLKLDNDIDAIITASNSKNSIFDSKQNRYLNRENIKIIQTPQLFKYKVIMDAYDKYMNQNIYDIEKYTDDLSLLLSLNNKALYKFFINQKNNIKITTTEDLSLFKGMIDEI